MRIFGSLVNRVACILANQGRDFPRATAVIAVIAVSMSSGHLNAQIGGVRKAEQLELPSPVRRSNHVAQAPESTVPPLPSNSTYSSATEMPGVVGPPIMGSQPIISEPYYAPSMGYEIPCPDAGCDVTAYVSFEALYFKREGDERLSLSRNDRLPEFDEELQGRYTAGRLFDCVNGIEAVFVGPYDWSRQTIATGSGSLISRFIPSGGYTPGEVSAFNFADVHSQLHEVSLSSYEINRRWWAWDVLSTMIGLRAIDYREHYAFVSSNSAVGTGIFTEDTDNLMVGAQVGADMMYPLGLRTSVSMRGKAGVFANFDESRVLLLNAGTLVLDAIDRDIDLAGLVEYGIYGRYQLVPSIRLTAGYEFWFLPGAATVSGQAINRVHPDSGNQVESEDEVFFHGGSVGVQVLF